jgi:hypothetical protein
MRPTVAKISLSSGLRTGSTPAPVDLTTDGRQARPNRAAGSGERWLAEGRALAG